METYKYCLEVICIWHFAPLYRTATRSYEWGESYWEQRENYDFPIDQIEVGPQEGVTNGGSEAELGRAAWIFQAKYNYDGRYLVEGSLRRDGSDRFAPGKRWRSEEHTSELQSR